jgi:hypothetical protein
MRGVLTEKLHCPNDEIGAILYTVQLLQSCRSLQYLIYAVLLRQESGTTYKLGNGVVGEGVIAIAHNVSVPTSRHNF